MMISILVLILGLNPFQDLTRKFSELSYKEAQSSQIRLPLKENPQDLLLPQFEDKKVFFAQWSSPITGHKPMWVAVDRSKGSEFYDKLYIDLNCNNSLKDEQALMALKTDISWSRFKPVKILGYGLHIDFFGYPKLQGFYAGAATWCEGEVNLGKENISCGLIDFNSNGIFNDIHMTNSAKQDRIVIDGAVFHLGKYIRFKGTYYQVTLKQDGSSICFEKLDDKNLGLLKVPKDLYSLTLGGINGQFSFEAKERRIRAPAGQWRIIDWRMNNGSWSLHGFDFPKNHSITITLEEETFLGLGEDIKACLNITKVREEYEFSERLEGSFGEKVVMESHSDTARPPMLLVVNTDETYGELFDFKYG